MNRILAVKFAAWLNPDFELWVYSTIDYLLFGQYEELKKNLTEAATIKKQIALQEEKLKDNKAFQKYKDLKTADKQLAHRRSKKVKNQIEGLMIDLELNPENELELELT